MAILFLLGGEFVAGCDADAISDRIQRAVGRQSERAKTQTAREERKAKGGRQGLPAPIASALDLIEASDAEFLAVKGTGKKRSKVRTYSGREFASMLTSKTIWLGRGIEDLPTWLDEIATASFFGGDTYRVRRPDGQEEALRPWIERQIAAWPDLGDGPP
ncbi:MAG: hypothetical protein R3B09_11105 [Nannocystaceae bacterium]